MAKLTVKADSRIKLHNPQNDPAPDCSDCKRKHLMGEHVVVRVLNRPEPVWEGCIDCWLKRTSPEMCESFLKE